MTSGQEQVIAIILTSMGVIFIPLLILLVRIIAKWTKLEVKLDILTDDMKELVESKDKIHSAIFAQMTEDRKSTDKRLRWLEEKVWGKS